MKQMVTRNHYLIFLFLMKNHLMLFVIYFFSAISFANHCNSGASHNGPDRQADQAGYMESNESAKTEKESKDESSDAMNKAEKDA